MSASGRHPDTWVIVPCYNEASVVKDVLLELSEYFANIVVVDDGSTDGSAVQARAADVRVVRHAINLGAGAALQTGIEFVLLDRAAKYVVTFDADGQHRPQDASAMVNRLRQEDLDILIGSRFLGATTGMAPSRRRLLQAARLFEWASSRVRLTDAHNGLRAFTRTFAQQIQLTFSDMAHASELLGQIAASALPYGEHPVTVVYTDYTRQKGQRSINSVNIAVDVWLSHLLRGRR